jgi:CheY-like chemotaxis protein
MFRHEADAKSLGFTIDIDASMPPSFSSDPKRLQQILKNLLSNAFKFTAQGHVSLTVRHVTSGWTPDHSVLRRSHRAVAFSVADTGIGIAPDKQKLIFEAFQQADAGTSRKYGGTGLGLAISRELAGLLGGEIRLTSSPGEGSTFTLYLPDTYEGPVRPVLTESGVRVQTPVPLALSIVRSEEAVPDDREGIAEGDAVLLIVDDDPHYARVLLGLARDKGFKGIVANRGGTALALAREFKPTAITLDVFLPDMLGWTVLNNLKLDPETRHIPVQMLSVEEERQHGLAHGAFSYLVKPATTEALEGALDRIKTYAEPQTRQLLVVEDNQIERDSIVELLAFDDISIKAVGTAGEAMKALDAQHFDCVVLDLRLPDVSGFELLELLRGHEGMHDVPIVVFTGKELSEAEELKLQAYAKSIVLKDVSSPERLFDETALFLHRVVSQLPAETRRLIDNVHGSNDVLRGRKVLVVDDDARNIFALTSVLENTDMEVFGATNGRQAIEIVNSTPGLSAVLMDIMMPEMDGYETIRRIRRDSRFRRLPIVALTAHAMKGDREKCLEAGASDYIAKPVNTDQLLSLMRVWLHR